MFYSLIYMFAFIAAAKPPNLVIPFYNSLEVRTYMAFAGQCSGIYCSETISITLVCLFPAYDVEPVLKVGGPVIKAL